MNHLPLIPHLEPCPILPLGRAVSERHDIDIAIERAFVACVAPAKDNSLKHGLCCAQALHDATQQVLIQRHGST